MTNIEFERIFNTLFFASENTVLVNGIENDELEPLYMPATQHRPAQIIYAHGYLASALHEVAHWCYAGAERRTQVDYGYWYAGDQRDQTEQTLFESVELVPQAYEYILSRACGIGFKVSLDNFNPNVVLDRGDFTKKVYATAEQKMRDGMSPRLRRLLGMLELRHLK